MITFYYLPKKHIPLKYALSSLKKQGTLWKNLKNLKNCPRSDWGIKSDIKFSLIALAVVLIIALAKITYTLAIMVFNTSSVVPYDVAEQAVMFFLYFGFIGLIVQYFKSGYHFPLRYFIYAGITAMLRLIIVNHESSVDTILFAGAILIMVIALLFSVVFQ